MHVLSVALFDKPAFSNVICHGVVLDRGWPKLSKRLRNYPDPLEVFETIGSDALRWYLMSSPILRGLDLESNPTARYARGGAPGPQPDLEHLPSLHALRQRRWLHGDLATDSTNLLDRYILAKTHEMVATTTDRLEAYDLAGASCTVQGFLDALTNWYIRRSRARFWNTDETTAGRPNPRRSTPTPSTPSTPCSSRLTKIISPLLPFLAEELWAGLRPSATSTRTGSVHLQDWPEADDCRPTLTSCSAWIRLRDVASAALSLRDERGLRIRLPLARAIVAGANVKPSSPFVELLADEINVKTVAITDDVDSIGSFRLRPNGRVLGPKLGPDVQTVIKAAKEGDWTPNDDGSVTVAGHILSGDDFELALDPLDGVAATPLSGNDAVVVLDTVLTPELEAEGQARDLVRFVQQLRKDRDLNVTDRIRLDLDLSPAIHEALLPHLDWVASQVLASEVKMTEGLAQRQTLDGVPIGFDLEPLG